MDDDIPEDQVYYRITVVSRLLDLSTQTILRYERVGLIRCAPEFSEEREEERCYDSATLARLRRIKWLTTDLGVNLAGVEVILRLLDRLEETRR